MDANKKAYIEICAEYNKKIYLGDNLPTLKMKSINQLDEQLFSYIYLFSNYINEFKAKKKDLYFDITKDEKSVMDFALFLNYFTDCSNIDYKLSTIKLGDTKYINIENFSDFMEVICILHHRHDGYASQSKFKPANDVARKMMEEVERRKKNIQEKINKMQKDDDKGSGFLELTSTISARHPSLNLLNIGDLNYYQILDQYKRLMMIDKYTPCLYGNATEEYIKENKVEHYGAKIK